MNADIVSCSLKRSAHLQVSAKPKLVHIMCIQIIMQVDLMLLLDSYMVQMVLFRQFAIPPYMVCYPAFCCGPSLLKHPRRGYTSAISDKPKHIQVPDFHFYSPSGYHCSRHASYILGCLFYPCVPTWSSILWFCRIAMVQQRLLSRRGGNRGGGGRR